MRISDNTNNRRSSQHKESRGMSFTQRLANLADANLDGSSPFLKEREGQFDPISRLTQTPKNFVNRDWIDHKQIAPTSRVGDGRGGSSSNGISSEDQKKIAQAAKNLEVVGLFEKIASSRPGSSQWLGSVSEILVAYQAKMEEQGVSENGIATEMKTLNDGFNEKMEKNSGPSAGSDGHQPGEVSTSTVQFEHIGTECSCGKCTIL